MAIPVKCPECAWQFHVDFAFAGRHGRCPECDAIIDVPAAPSNDFDDEVDNEPVVGGFSSASRRSTEPPRVRNEPRQQPRFDPTPRIEKWKKVAGGFRNLAIAASLVAINTTIRGAFDLMNGVTNDANQLTSAQKALMVGNVMFTALAISLWAIGRVGLAKTPYLPASIISKTSAVMAIMTAVPGVIGMCVSAVGVVVAADDLRAGLIMIQLGGCGLALFSLGWIVAEIVGLLAQIRITSGLEAVGASRFAKIHLATFITGICVSTIGFCALAIAMGTLVKKAQEEQQAQQAKQALQEQQAKGKNPPLAGQGKLAGPGPAANPRNPPPPPKINLEEHKDTVAVIFAVVAASTIGFALMSLMSFLSAQAAVRKEIHRLTNFIDGNPDDVHDRFALGD